MHPVVEKELLIEKVLGYITPHLAVLEVKNKPTYLHCVRVGMWLYERDYDIDIILAGFLHDVLEDTSLTYEDIKNAWGDEVADMVLANTYRIDLPREESRRDVADRCKKNGIGACIVKAADAMDGLKHYIATGNVDQIAGLKNKCEIFLEDLPYEDPVFDELQSVLESVE